MTRDWVLAQFARQKKRAVALYEDFVSERGGVQDRILSGNGADRSLSEDCFVEEVMVKAAEKFKLNLAMQQVIAAVCAQYGIRPQDRVRPRGGATMCRKPKSRRQCGHGHQDSPGMVKSLT